MPLRRRSPAPRAALVAVVAAPLALALPGALAAADGVLELDPACAPVGCFPGDSPGYPIQITQSGSYKLTGNLDVRSSPDPTTVEAVQISAPSVTLDLAGFLVIGPVACSGPPVSCSPAAPSAGIHLLDDADAAVVRNGIVAGFGYGVYATAGAVFPRVEGMTLWSNSAAGLYAGGPGAQAVGVTAYLNGGKGLWLGQAATVRRSTAARNQQEGILAGSDGLFVDNSIYDNGTVGLQGAGRSLYARNVSSENGIEGVRDTGNGALVYGNASSNNATFGLLLGGSGSGYSENVFYGNPLPVGGGLSLNQNACNGAGC